MKNTTEAVLRLVQISTTSNVEEDFLLVTNLTDEEIELVITPIVEKERREEQFEEFFYDNEGLYWALKTTYPNSIIQQYCLDQIDSITI
jgi:hypothetical protein